MAAHVLQLAAAAAAVAGFSDVQNYSVLLRHGSQASCPCFRIPCMVTTQDTAQASTLVLLVEARWDSSECYPIAGKKPPVLPPSPPALALVSSTDAGRSWNNLTIIKSAKCGPTCNPHAVWSSAARKLVVTFMSHEGIAVLSTPDPTGRTGWTSPTSLEPWLGKDWASKGYPGPGVAIAIALPNGGERLLFVAHAGAYLQDVVFFSDDSGATFNVSSSTPYVTKDNVLKGMNEAAFAQLSNGSVLLVMRNFGSKGEPPRFKNGTRPLSHNPLCADNGICKAFSRSDDAGVHWSNVGYFGTVRSGSCEAGVLGRNGSLYISVGDSDAPPNTGRMRMTLHRSRDDGASWHNMALLDPNNSAYSQLVMLKSRPGEIGVLWEALSPDKWFIGEMRLQWLPS